MGDSYLEDLYYKYTDDALMSETSRFYYNRLYEDIKLFAKPELVDDVEDHFYDLILGHSGAEAIGGFKQGFRLAMQFMSECMDTYIDTEREAATRYNYTCQSGAKKHDKLKSP